MEESEINIQNDDNDIGPYDDPATRISGGLHQSVFLATLEQNPQSDYNYGQSDSFMDTMFSENSDENPASNVYQLGGIQEEASPNYEGSRPFSSDESVDPTVQSTIRININPTAGTVSVEPQDQSHNMGRSSMNPNSIGRASINPGSMGRPSINPGNMGRPSINPGNMGRPSINPGSMGRPSINPGGMGRPSINPGSMGRPSINPGSMGRPSINPGNMGRPSINPGSMGRPSINPSSMGRPSVFQGSGRPSVFQGSMGRPSINPNSMGRPSMYQSSMGRPSTFQSMGRPSINPDCDPFGMDPEMMGGRPSMNPSMFRQSVAHPSILARPSMNPSMHQRQMSLRYASDTFDDEDPSFNESMGETSTRRPTAYPSTGPKRQYCVDGPFEGSDYDNDMDMYSMHSQSIRSSRFDDQFDYEYPDPEYSTFATDMSMAQPEAMPIPTDPDQQIDYEVTLEEIPMPNGESKSRISIRAAPTQSKTLSSKMTQSLRSVTNDVWESPSKQVQTAMSAPLLDRPVAVASNKNMQMPVDMTRMSVAQQRASMAPTMAATPESRKSVKSRASTRAIPTVAEIQRTATLSNFGRVSDGASSIGSNLKPKSQVHFDINIMDHENKSRTIVLKRSVQSQSKMDNASDEYDSNVPL